MADMEQKREIRRMVRLLRQMTEFAEHVEQTGSFESGAKNSVKRYNAIVEHLEDEDIIHEEMFPKLEDKSDFGQLGAETMALANYLEDMLEEDEQPRSSGSKDKPDFSWLMGLAPFLEQAELSKLVRTHFTGQPTPTEETDTSQGPDLKTIVGLAPHIDSKTLGDMVRACLSHQKLTDPKMLVALAPHMDQREFTQILHEYLPHWFGASAAPKPEPPPPSPPAPPPATNQEIARTSWGAWGPHLTPPSPAEDHNEE